MPPQTHNDKVRQAVPAFVTTMSRSCHLFSEGSFHACFRVTVDDIVTMNLTFNRQTLPLRADFLIAGTRCHLSTNSHDIMQLASQRQSQTKLINTSSFEMEVLVDSSRSDCCEQAAHFRGLRHIVFATLPHGSFVAFDLLRKRVHAALSPSASRDLSFWNALLLPITIGVLGTTLGVVPLHCACLDRKGKGLLVAGVSGAGKSTLAAALAQRGFAFISDDWTYLTKQQSTLVAHGLFSPIKLLPDTIRFFPRLHEFVLRKTLNGEMAYEMDPQKFLQFIVTDMSRPGHIVFLERTATRGCHLVPCRPEYVRDFFEKSAERLPDELAEAKAMRTGIIHCFSACPSWMLRTGESPQRTAEAIEMFLSEAERATA